MAKKTSTNNHIFAKIIFPLVGFLLVIAPSFNARLEKMSAGLAVISGILLAVIFHNPYLEITKKITPKLLTWSVVGLGCGMNLITVAKVGFSGLSYTFISIFLTSFVGLLLGYFLKNSRDTSVLVTFGTSICGGSAIAAIAPTMRAKGHEVSIALAIVFLLNGVSLLVFPPLGHYFNLTQHQFGLWSALAIHDTSSVVGATLQYGKEALEVGTTVKLARALWIIPVTLILSFVYSKYIFHKETSSDNQSKPKKPWFILGFLLAAALVTWVPFLQTPGFFVRHVAERALILCLFCIGGNLSRSAIKSVGFKPFVQGLILWIVTATVVLIAVKRHWL